MSVCSKKRRMVRTRSKTTYQQPSLLFQQGDHVQAKWKDGRKYPAIVEEVGEQLLTVRYIEDGTVQRLNPKLVFSKDNSRNPSLTGSSRRDAYFNHNKNLHCESLSHHGLNEAESSNNSSKSVETLNCQFNNCEARSNDDGNLSATVNSEDRVSNEKKCITSTCDGNFEANAYALNFVILENDLTVCIPNTDMPHLEKVADDLHCEAVNLLSGSGETSSQNLKTQVIEVNCETSTNICTSVVEHKLMNYGTKTDGLEFELGIEANREASTNILNCAIEKNVAFCTTKTAVLNYESGTNKESGEASTNTMSSAMGNSLEDDRNKTGLLNFETVSVDEVNSEASIDTPIEYISANIDTGIGKHALNCTQKRATVGHNDTFTYIRKTDDVQGRVDSLDGEETSTESEDDSSESYSPNAEEESNDSEYEEPILGREKRCLKTATNTLDDAFASDSSNSVIGSVSSSSAPLQNAIQESDKLYKIRACTKKPNGKRAFNKAHYCLYCNKPKTQLPKHYERRHKNENYVKETMSLPKGSAERKLLFEKMRNYGDYTHNSKVQRAGEGVIITKKSLSHPSEPEKYISCRFCRGTFLKKHLHRHVKKCKFRPEQNMKRGGKIMSSCALIAPPADTATKGLIANVLSTMRNDEISSIAHRDRLILSFGSKLYEHIGNDPHKFKDVSSSIREVARLLAQLKILFPSKEFRDFIVPQHFTDVVEATRVISKWDENTGTFGKPSLAVRIGHHLGKLAGLMITDGLRKKNEEQVKSAEQFLSLREREWSDKISTHALRTLRKRKFNKPVILPLVDDLMKMLTCLKEKAIEYYSKLSTDFTDRSAWYELTQVTLTQVIMFNRRRSGEAARVLLSNYLDRSTSPMHQDIMSALSEFEKKLCAKLCRFEVEGKRGRKVPVILTQDMKDSVDLLVETRNTVGVHQNNPHLFARPYFNSLESVRGNDCLNKYAGMCGAEHPEFITSTNLRKHVGTIAQLYNLTENELDLLCGFMGHDIKIHRKFYRLPEGTLQVAKVSKILIAMDQGQSHLYKGKSLDEIDFDANEVVEEQDGDEEDHVPHVEGIENGPEDEINNCTPKIGNGGESPNRSMQSKKLEQKDGKNQKASNSGNISERKEGTNSKGKSVTEVHQSHVRGPKKASSVKVPWTKEECEAVKRCLSSCFRESRVPGKAECEKCKKSEPKALFRREWKSIKYYVKNEITKLNKVK